MHRAHREQARKMKIKRRELSRDNFVSHATDYFFLKQLRCDAACRFCWFCDRIHTLQYAQLSWYFDFAALASLLHNLFNFKSSWTAKWWVTRFVQDTKQRKSVGESEEFQGGKGQGDR